jgi:hypothetical protein
VRERLRRAGGETGAPHISVALTSPNHRIGISPRPHFADSVATSLVIPFTPSA